MDLALVAHLSTIRASIPFLHFFDGFRTSHEIQKVEMIDYNDIPKLVNWDRIKQHRDRALNPEHPVLKGSAQNPDIYFQVTEAANQFYLKIPEIVEEEMKKVSNLTGRSYKLFDYFGDKKAENIIIMMGSGAEHIQRVAKRLNAPSDRFVIEGPKPQQEVAETLGRSMILFLPSRSEAFPLAIGEAGCMGCTIVGSPLEAVKHVTRGGDRGTVAAGFDEESLLAALFADTDKWVLGRYDPSAIAEKCRAEFNRRSVANRIIRLALDLAGETS